MGLDIYGTSKDFQRYVERIKESKEIPEQSKESLLSFFDYAFATGLSKVRVLIYAQKLYPVARALGKPFREASKQDLQRVVGEIERNPAFSEWTKYTYETIIKRFYKWLEGNDKEYPEKVKWIKARTNNRTKLLPEELLTRKEVWALVDAAENPRDKAFIAVLYDSGCRIGEVANLKIKSVSFDKNGAAIMVQGKTGQRRVRLIESFHQLSYWLESHPFKENPEAPLWPRLTGKKRGHRVNYADIRRQLRKIKDKAGVKKPVNPHAFRHARATHLAKRGLNEAQLNAFFGWTQGSQMARTYIHLSGQDVDDALLKAYGLAPEDKQEDNLACARCNTANEVTARFCKTCGMPLSTMAAVEQDNTLIEFEKKIAPLMSLLEQPEIMKIISGKLAKREIQN